MSNILEGLQGVVCQIDVLVLEVTHKEHDDRLMAVLKRLESAGVTLNLRKCEFAKDQVQVSGHQVSKAGIQAAPQKVAAIVQMKTPNNVTELCCFLDMINQCQKFSPNLAELILNYYESYSLRIANGTGARAVNPTILALYNPVADTKISANASSFRLGAMLLQREDRALQLIAFASRAMTETESMHT